jgi:hypothetical protein
MTSARSFFKENATLVYFLIAQLVAIGAAVLSITAYMTRLEGRVVTLETRGSVHLSGIDNRLTVLESKTETNKDAIERIKDIMIKDLGKKL